MLKGEKSGETYGSVLNAVGEGYDRLTVFVFACCLSLFHPLKMSEPDDLLRLTSKFDIHDSLSASPLRQREKKGASLSGALPSSIARSPRDRAQLGPAGPREEVFMVRRIHSDTLGESLGVLDRGGRRRPP